MKIEQSSASAGLKLAELGNRGIQPKLKVSVYLNRVQKCFLTQPLPKTQPQEVQEKFRNTENSLYENGDGNQLITDNPK